MEAWPGSSKNLALGRDPMEPDSSGSKVTRMAFRFLAVGAMTAFFFIALSHSAALACSPPQSCGQGNGNGNGPGVNQGQGNRPPAAIPGNAGPPPQAIGPSQSANVSNANRQPQQAGTVPVVVPNQNAAVANQGGPIVQQQLPVFTNNPSVPSGGQTGGRSMSNPDGHGV